LTIKAIRVYLPRTPLDPLSFQKTAGKRGGGSFSRGCLQSGVVIFKPPLGRLKIEQTPKYGLWLSKEVLLDSHTKKAAPMGDVLRRVRGVVG